MQKKLLIQLIKSNLNDKKSVNKLIDEFVSKHTSRARKDLDEFLSNLLVYIHKNFNKIAKKELLPIIKSKLQDLNITFDTKDIDTIYAQIATATTVGTTKIVFDKVDVGAIDAMRKGFYWVRDKYNSETQDILMNTIEDAFRGDVKRADVSALLKERFEGMADKGEKYYKLVSDNIISQAQNISRVNQALKYDVKFFKAKAKIDSRTSDFCRAINGRIINAGHLKNQVDMILGAKSIDDKKEAAKWVSKPIFGALPANIGLPPYHGHCRTIVVPVWISEDVQIDPKTKKKYTVKNTRKDKAYALQSIDKTGVEVKVRPRIYDKILKKHNMSEKELVGAMNDIKYKAPHATTSQHPNEHIKTVALTNGGYVLVYESDQLVSCYRPTRRKSNYFNDNAELGKIEDVDSGKIIERVKKWYEFLT